MSDSKTSVPTGAGTACPLRMTLAAPDETLTRPAGTGGWARASPPDSDSAAARHTTNRGRGDDMDGSRIPSRCRRHNGRAGGTFHADAQYSVDGGTALDGDQLLGIFLRGALGRSGRKRARRASTFLGGGFLTASTVMAAVGVAWGLYDSLKASQPAAPGAPVPPSPATAAPLMLPPDVARVVRLAVSAARADGTLADAEREAILRHAREAGIAEHVDAELAQPRPLSEIVAGVTAEAARRDLYVLAFTIVRADETVSGAERIYLAQLAHALGLDPAAAAALEQQTAAAIDGPGLPTPPTP
jgi:uncharacterized membrane protein YebE (DUF533 family)